MAVQTYPPKSSDKLTEPIREQSHDNEPNQSLEDSSPLVKGGAAYKSPALRAGDADEFQRRLALRFDLNFRTRVPSPRSSSEGQSSAVNRPGN